MRALSKMKQIYLSDRFQSAQVVPKLQKRFSSFKDVSISIVSYGGKDAIDQSNISFDPSKGELGDFTLNF